jgi:hypothetical protein
MGRLQWIKDWLKEEKKGKRPSRDTAHIGHIIWLISEVERLREAARAAHLWLSHSSYEDDTEIVALLAETLEPSGRGGGVT